MNGIRSSIRWLAGGLEEDGVDGSLESSIRYLIYCPCVAYMERSSNFVEKCTTGGGEQRMLWFPFIGLCLSCESLRGRQIDLIYNVM